MFSGCRVSLLLPQYPLIFRALIRNLLAGLTGLATSGYDFITTSITPQGACMAKRFPSAIFLISTVLLFVGTSMAAQDSGTAPAAGNAATPAAVNAAAQIQQPAAPVSSSVAAPKDTNRSVQAPAAPAKQADARKKKPVEEDLYEEMLVPERGVAQPEKAVPAAPAAAKTDTAAAKSAAAPRNPADTSKAAGVVAPVKETVGALDTAHPASSAVQAPGADTARKPAASAAKPGAPVKIEAARQINFAKNLKEYRSPKLAMLMSLIVPGLGQAYVKSYVRAGLYILAEAAIIGTSVAYNNMANDRYNQAKSFANRNYSGSKMVAYYDSLLLFLQNPAFNVAPLSDSDANAKMNDIYFDTLKSFKHGDSTKSQSFYSTIESSEYIQGWKDCQPTLSQIAAVNAGIQLPDQANYKYTYTRYDTLEYTYLVSMQDKTSGATVGLDYGYSDSLLAYRKIMNQYHDNSRIATNILFILLVNHVVSAVDALISANVYNSNLLGKQSFWRNIDLEPFVAGSGITSGPALTLRLRF
jgi:Family of unknown function (DUF5683)